MWPSSSQTRSRTGWSMCRFASGSDWSRRKREKSLRTCSASSRSGSGSGASSAPLCGSDHDAAVVGWRDEEVVSHVPVRLGDGGSPVRTARPRAIRSGDRRRDPMRGSMPAACRSRGDTTAGSSSIERIADHAGWAGRTCSNPHACRRTFRRATWRETRRALRGARSLRHRESRS
jgi:hypothetical protein